MATREELEATMKSALASSEKKIAEMKAKMADAGDDVSDEASVALAEAEKMWEKGKVKFDELSSASDETYEEMKADLEANWDSISKQLESGWTSVSSKVKEFFS
jgi:hypothetical protein